MNLETALNEIANQVVPIGKGSLVPYAAEDTIGGWHPDPSQRLWPVGSVFEAEGKVLYALIRALKPRTCVEIGIQDGCSASHIAAALQANDFNIGGHLTSIDRANSGTLIPDDLRPYVTIVGGDGAEWLEAQPDGSIDFLFEDADHSEDLAYRVGLLAKTKLKPGGVFVAHDAAHYLVGADIRAGYTRAGLDYRVYSIEPSDCGLLIWRQPGVWVEDVEPEVIEEAPKAEPEVRPVKKTPARKPAAKAKGKAAK